MKDIARYIIKTVQDNAWLNGFQYIISYSMIEDEFNIELNAKMVEEIVEALEWSEEVADVEYDDYDIDVVLYTNYAPNYREEDYI